VALSAMYSKGAVALVVFETFDDRFNQQKTKKQVRFPLENDLDVLRGFVMKLINAVIYYHII
jgi:hypothetical protein